MAAAFTICDALTGLPVTGLSPIWKPGTYRNFKTGVAAAEPAISEIGTTGKYKSDQDPGFCGFWDCGAGVALRYPFFPPSGGLVFAAWDAAGVPVAGLEGSLAWRDGGPYDPASDAPVVGTTFAAIGDGAYRIDGANGQPIVGDVDLGAGQNPPSFSVNVAPDPAPPAIGVPTPAPGSDLGPTDSVTFALTQGTVELEDLSVLAVYPNGTAEPIVLAGTLVFTSAFSTSGLVIDGDGNAAVTITRDHGWRRAPHFYVTATDKFGNIVTADWAFVLPTPATGPVVENVTPATGTMEDKDAVLSFDLVDHSLSLAGVVVILKFPGSNVWEAVYDGSDLAPNYLDAGSTTTPIAGGVRLALRRKDGWPIGQQITLRVVPFEA